MLLWHLKHRNVAHISRGFGADSDLRSDVESLLASFHAAGSDFLSVPDRNVLTRGFLQAIDSGDSAIGSSGFAAAPASLESDLIGRRLGS